MMAQVFRPTRDEFSGDATDEGYLGDIDGIIIGAATPETMRSFPGVMSSEGMIGIPRSQESGIIVEQGDRLDFIQVSDSDTFERQVRYAVTAKLFDEPHALTGSQFSHYWVRVEATQ